MRISPAPRAQRITEGSVALTPRPRASGAIVKGVYDIPAGQFVYIGNDREMPPWRVSDRRFLTWGARWRGTDSAFDLLDPSVMGLTLWSLDADGNPTPLGQAGTSTHALAGEASTYGAILGEGHDAVTQILQTGKESSVRYLGWGPFPGPFSISAPIFSVQSFRVVGDSIAAGPTYERPFLTDTAPPGAVILGHMNLGPDFIWQLRSPQILGLSQSAALLFGGTAKDGDDALIAWFAVWHFDPFNPSGLVDPANPTIGRQPDVLIEVAGLGLLPNLYSFFGVRRTNTEAVVVVVSYSGAGVLEGASQVNILRLDAAGALISNVVAGDFTSQYYGGNTFPEYMGAGIVHSGDLRIDAGWSALESSAPNAGPSGRYLRSPTRRYDDDRFLYIRQDDDADPNELTFTTKGLLAEDVVALITSTADVDVEVADINQIMAGGHAGVVGENLLAMWRYPTFSARNQVITVELGTGRHGTLAFEDDARRFTRLPQRVS